MIDLIILLLLIGAGLFLLDRFVTIDARIKTAIYVVVTVGTAIYILRHLGQFGL